jgi:REP element-mobilizing transposase RayT
VKQRELPFKPANRPGGFRKGAGRKPRGAKAGVPHRSRPEHKRRFPIHVTLRVREHVWNLRALRCYTVLRRAFGAAKERPGFRLTHYSVQGNHMHLIVEAGDARALTRGMRGLDVWLARRLNTLMGKRGSVFADRYHVHELRTPREVRNALDYVYNNAHRHFAATGQRPAPFFDAFSSSRWFDGWTRDARAQMRTVLGEPTGPPPVTEAGTWLLTIGWRRNGLIELRARG